MAKDLTLVEASLTGPDKKLNVTFFSRSWVRLEIQPTTDGDS